MVGGDVDVVEGDDVVVRLRVKQPEAWRADVNGLAGEVSEEADLLQVGGQTLVQQQGVHGQAAQPQHHQPRVLGQRVPHRPHVQLLTVAQLQEAQLPAFQAERAQNVASVDACASEFRGVDLEVLERFQALVDGNVAQLLGLQADEEHVPQVEQVELLQGLGQQANAVQVLKTTSRTTRVITIVIIRVIKAVLYCFASFENGPLNARDRDFSRRVKPTDNDDSLLGTKAK